MESTQFNLNNGTRIPAIGLGASIVPKGNGKIAGNEPATRQWHMYQYMAVNHRDVVYDISPSYGLAEYILGNVIEHVGHRENMYIALKISNYEQRGGDVKKAFENHLARLHTDYVDLLMLHWPHPGTFVQSWLALEEIYASGRAKALGVSNFHEHHFAELMERAKVLPAVNQIEVHPLFTQEPLRAYCAGKGIHIMAYTPLGRMHDVLMKNKVLRQIAARRHKTVPQIILRWDVDSGMTTIPRTLTPAHFEEDLDIFSFALTPEEIKAIDGVNENVRLRFNPDTVDYNMV